MFYEPSKGHGLPHDPSKAIVAPRPIGWISTIDRQGKINLAPYSFFNAFSTKPFIVWFSSEGEKDSATFAEETGEFVANLVSRDLAQKMNRTAVDAPRGVSEFGYADLTMAPSRLVAPPRVAEAPAALECRVTEIIRPRALDGTQTSAVVVAGEVVGVHIDDAYLKDGIFDIVRAGNVGRLGYMDYASIDEIFSMRRPRWGKD
ncbi:MAG: flavin reductase family protein [Mesorhizobium sp.]|uniref:flavin reductase family protein n=1 Tax=unclassified Mesorhizobium TaxID=325217 RepID=UPI000F7529F5|nr:MULTISPECIES: flavin reductase family protein [unclassified Mesorhizobium]RVD72211.1 flavin reductase family protein [Mesorhizobium sp. M4A.F.Ca.ET.029.04.2.1]AZO46770.1 flavin reductase family protein [Mesorhizobium sp. M4B.F.Ca.ET.058.02.1.1]RUX36940.1 flavin reductase family protein [Mesorhizobium sp. M4A.F.Ca.ET.050.02.1.1]RVC40837.1 flavin reductase family protein [Mesorhizobium sp. M4A.F.Ca.ET.090.04.2.1]RVC73564.1 flavin reductase family protein [Mesorhizobium sp. M4A.F.Ca.ET.022.05.